MPLTQNSSAWAQPEDWAKHRTTITDLYVKRRKKMKAVIRIMAEEYGFHATQRMYKTRFKKWGLTKNIRSKPACVKDARLIRAGRPAMSASGSPETETDQQSKQPIAPIMSLRQITNHGSIHILQHLGSPSAIRSISSPDCYRYAEVTFYYTQIYISSTGFPSLESSASEKRLVTDAACAEWIDCALTAKALLKFGYFRQAVLLVDVCCRQYRSLLSSRDLSLMPITVVAIQKILRYWPGLARAFLNFVCTMAQIVLGANHPLSMLFHKLKEAGIDNLSYCICMALQHFLGGIVHVMPHPMIDSYGDFYYDMIHGKVLHKSVIWSEIQHLQSRLQNRLQGGPESECLFVEETTAIKCRMAWLHFHEKRYKEATELLLGMLNEPTADAHVTSGCCDILHDIAVAENKHDSALDMIQKAVEASIEAYGYAHSTTVRKMAYLEYCLRRMGRLPEADKVYLDSEMQLIRICERG
ncbi:Clr5 domain-containing protein [Xylaria cf. heliscus]|nr:Clr5 domain-containing protein [Xylaria cf. heliscus]